MSASEKIFKLFSNEVFLDIAITCANEPKTAKQIADALGYKIVNVGQWIQRLEEEGILEFTGNGWKTSGDAVRVIKKYFT